MNHLDLCSGIGGFALAASRVWADHTVLAFVEIDAFCRSVLARHWPDAPQHDDLRTFDARPLRGRVYLISAGYPCQPFSSSGLRRGAEDDRHLWPEVRRITAECRPRWCLFENVAGHITMGLDEVLADLEALGYEAWAVVIPAVAVDAPHRRDRVWIVAHDLADTDGQWQPQRERAVADIGRRAGDRCEARRGAAADADRVRREPVKPHVRAWQPDPSRRGVAPDPDGFDADGRGHGAGAVQRLESESPRHRRGEQALADADRERGSSGEAGGQDAEDARQPSRGEDAGLFWDPEPGVGRVADGVPRRVDRLKSLGNAIVPAVAEEILFAIQQADQ